MNPFELLKSADALVPVPNGEISVLLVPGRGYRRIVVDVDQAVCFEVSCLAERIGLSAEQPKNLERWIEQPKVINSGTTKLEVVVKLQECNCFVDVGFEFN
jgi:hypothetical protein